MVQMLILTLLLPACLASCVSGKGTVGDRGPCQQQFAVVGSEVILNCNASEEAAGVEWRLNGSVVPSGVGVGAQLILHNASLAEEGQYSCHDPGTGEAWTWIELLLGYPPAQPKVECWAVRYPEAVDCSWTLEPASALSTSFIAVYRQGMATLGEDHRCLQLSPEASSCVIQDLQMFSITPCVLNVTAINPLGASSSLVPFFVENIIKPGSPENVRVSPLPGRKLLVQWSPPASWPSPQYFPLKYLIRYQRQGTANFHQVGPREQTSFILTGLWPRTPYQVQVATKDFTDYGEYSAWSPSVAAIPGAK
ncbi:interleukin-27 subunit beta [Tachyglossus aculeatus]|uniref:interleukin-27 subunit beta n=1 Tax=Tachyglossus aculeatus TaxID=9261 RepID=UPI0018F2939A|nr:interleukin-27 subunit beta [Tachyglossus aculeatus]